MSGLHPNLKAALQDVLTEAELLGMGHAELAGIFDRLGYSLIEAKEGKRHADHWHEEMGVAHLTTNETRFPKVH